MESSGLTFRPLMDRMPISRSGLPHAHQQYTKVAWHLLLVLALCSSILRGQCSGVPYPYPPTAEQVSLEGWREDVVIEAVLLINCCATCTSNQDLISAADALLEMMDDGHILQESDGTTDWEAQTSPDSVGGSSEWWDSSLDNYIIVNDETFGTTNNPEARHTIAAAILVHEYIHCATLVNCRQGGEWADECDYWENELMCYIIEKAMVECIINCGCVNVGSITGEGEAALENQMARCSSQITYYTGLLNGCPP